MSIPYKRQYAIGACFLCQQCLYCEKNLSFITCQCDLNTKPTLKNTKKEKRSLYSRVYNPKTKCVIYNKLQLEKLEEANKSYSYNINFLLKFNYSLCCLCHNVMARLKRKSSRNMKPTLLKIPKSTSNRKLSTKSNNKTKPLDESKSLVIIEKEGIYEISSGDEENYDINNEELSDKDNSIEETVEDTVITDEETGIGIDEDLYEESEEETSPEISFKLIIKQERESSVAKWEAINQTTFKDFKRKLNLLILTQLDKWVGYDEYIVSYKLKKETGSGTQLMDERDWKRFITEYHNSKKKETMIFATFKPSKNNSKSDKKK